jgi:ankyrin repeat protein
MSRDSQISINDHAGNATVNLIWFQAVGHGDAAAIGELLQRGADVDARDRHGQTGLMLAAHAGHREVVSTLIDHRADLNVTAKFGLSAVMLAIVAGRPEVARLLATAGADLSLMGSGAPGFAGKTARDLAADRGMSDLFAGL